MITVKIIEKKPLEVKIVGEIVEKEITPENLKIDYSEQVTGKPKINGIELIGDKTLEELGISGIVPAARIGYVALLSSAWVGEEGLYRQVVDIDGVTKNSQVDLTPSVEQLAVFYNKDLAFVTENKDGVVTVYAIGQKPENDYVIQVTMTEVYR